MRIVVLPFMLLAGLGFSLSLFAHVCALTKVPTPGGEGVFALHVGIFVVWIPSVFIMKRATRGASHKDAWKLALSGCPQWMRWGTYALFAYAVLNFIVFTTTAGTPESSGGTPPPSVVRGFSGHWMAFYGAAFAIMYSVRSRPDLLLERRCSAQHVMSPKAAYCETCGEPVSPASSGA